MNPPSRCRIMMTTDAVGGVWTYATDLASRLCARGHEVALVTLGPPPNREQLARLTGIEGLSIEVTGLALEWMDPDGTDTDAGDVLLTLADRICPDIVHLNSYREAALGWPAPVLVVAHSCVWSWWKSCHGSLPEEPRWDRYRAAVGAGLSAAQAWVAPTSAFREDIQRYYAPHTGGRVIHNGADVPICISPKEPFILAAGRLWDEAKNLRALEAIAAGLDWPVRAAGPIREPGRRGAPHACRGMEHLGALSHAELIVQMRRASIFVAPALYEPFGLSVLEAAAAGCALVLSDIPSLRELWAGAALFVDPSDCGALAETLQRLCRDEDLRGRLQQSARRRSRRYRLDSMVLGYEHIYAQLMNCAELGRPAARRAVGVPGMRFVLFCHSFLSCWNHGNAHFLRGLARELMRLGHEVTVYEPADGWSRNNLLADGGAAVLDEAAALVPGVSVRSYHGGSLDLDAVTDGADVVIVHEWNPPALIAALGRQRIGGAAFTLLFHDTHHRAVTAPTEMDALALDGYDAVLAFGEVLREVYLRRGWSRRAFTWHEAADTALFHPLTGREKDIDLIWIGNWGDDERSEEIESFLLEPAQRLLLHTRIYGVRYPAEILDRLTERGFDHAGWLPNHRAPEAFAHARFTVHVPRRPYTVALPGIPTIRVFEALACGIPLACAPWHDEERLFPSGAYLTARNQDSMTRTMSALRNDRDLTRHLAATGLQAINARHTCAHRARELMAIISSLRASCDRPRPGQAEPEQRMIVS